MAFLMLFYLLVMRFKLCVNVSKYTKQQTVFCYSTVFCSDIKVHGFYGALYSAYLLLTVHIMGTGTDNNQMTLP